MTMHLYQMMLCSSQLSSITGFSTHDLFLRLVYDQDLLDGFLFRMDVMHDGGVFELPSWHFGCTPCILLKGVRRRTYGHGHGPEAKWAYIWSLR